MRQHKAWPAATGMVSKLPILMTNEEFITLVEEMRSEQKRYFKAVSNSSEKYDALDKSKKKEKEVDKAITSYREKGSFSDPQTALFE